MKMIFALTVSAAALSASCMQTDWLTPTTETPITSAGGTAHSPDGELTLIFGSNYVLRQALVRIREKRELIPNWRLTPTYEITVIGGTVERNPTMTVHFPPAIDAQHEHAFLAEVSHDRPDVLSAFYDSGAHTLTAALYPSGTFAVVRQSIACEGMECGAGCELSSLCDQHSLCVPADTANLCAADPDGGIPDLNNGVCHEDGSIPFDNNIRIHPCGIEEIEPNDTPASAQAVLNMVDSAVDISATFDGNDDYYLLSIPGGTWGSIMAETFTEHDNYSTCTTGLNLALTVTDELGHQIFSIGPGGCPDLNYYDPQRLDGLWPGNFFIRVHGPAPSNGSMSYHFAIYLLGPNAASHTADGGILPRDSGF